MKVEDRKPQAVVRMARATEHPPQPTHSNGDWVNCDHAVCRQGRSAKPSGILD